MWRLARIEQQFLENHVSSIDAFAPRDALVAHKRGHVRQRANSRQRHVQLLVREDLSEQKQIDVIERLWLIAINADGAARLDR